MALVSCQPTPTATPQPTGPTQIVLVADGSLGGLVAYLRTTTIDMKTGAFTVESASAEPVTGSVPAADREALAALVEETGFLDYEADYIPIDGTCCDLVAYTVTVTVGGESHSVRASDENMPEGFRTLLSRIQALTGQ